MLGFPPDGKITGGTLNSLDIVKKFVRLGQKLDQINDFESQIPPQLQDFRGKKSIFGEDLKDGNGSESVLTM